MYFDLLLLLLLESEKDISESSLSLNDKLLPGPIAIDRSISRIGLGVCGLFFNSSYSVDYSGH